MVKIRYAELPTGLHVATEAGDRCTFVYLKPGLTRAQRKEALTVARRSARFGHGPSLPALDMAFALAADQTRTTARMTGSAIRRHPLLLLPLLALVLGFIAAGVLAAAALITVTPHASSAQSSGLYQFHIGQVVIPTPSARPGPSGGVPGSGTPGSVTRPQRQLASHCDSARHGREHTCAHSATGLPQAALAGRGRAASSVRVLG